MIIIGAVVVLLVGGGVALWAVSSSIGSDPIISSETETDDIDADDEGLTTFDVTGNVVNLSDYPANAKVKISLGGSYVVSGKLIGKLAVRTDDEVTLTFDNADITNAVGDGVNSSGNLVIAGGTVVINAGDDGIHSDAILTINDGNITITKSYEGLEAADLVVNGGTINITADDDGLNGAGASSAITTSRSGQSTSKGKITINGGNITIAPAGSGSGDGLDANGDLTITGGDIVIKTPANARDYSPLDADGAITISGGQVRTLGVDGTYTEITQESLSAQSGGTPSGDRPAGLPEDMPDGATAPGGPRGDK
jgi:hypothetical protein